MTRLAPALLLAVALPATSGCALLDFLTMMNDGLDPTVSDPSAPDQQGPTAEVDPLIAGYAVLRDNAFGGYDLLLANESGAATGGWTLDIPAGWEPTLDALADGSFVIDSGAGIWRVDPTGMVSALGDSGWYRSSAITSGEDDDIVIIADEFEAEWVATDGEDGGMSEFDSTLCWVDSTGSPEGEAYLLDMWGPGIWSWDRDSNAYTPVADLEGLGISVDFFETDEDGRFYIKSGPGQLTVVEADGSTLSGWVGGPATAILDLARSATGTLALTQRGEVYLVQADTSTTLVASGGVFDGAVAFASLP